MPLIEFKPSGKSIEVPIGTTILEAASKAGLLIESPCHGAGVCGKCKVRVEPEDLRKIKLSGSHNLPDAEAKSGYVLSCHAQILGDIRTTILERNEKGLSILKSGDSVELPFEPSAHKASKDGGKTYEIITHDGNAFRVESNSGSCLGLAVDIGTTTLVASLIDLSDGREIDSLSALNPQALHAGDVLSRIKIASKPEGLAKLHGEISAEIGRLASELAKRADLDVREIYDTVYAGNTCMLHLAANENPESLGKLPFTPSIRGGFSVPASHCGLKGFSQGARVHLPPIISGFVGADITAGILATGLDSMKGSTLFIDIGTNGEMVLSVDGRLIASSTAAGPAFEGMNISCGSRAVSGAVELYKVDGGRAIVRTIGDAPPKSLCGTGLIDSVAALVKGHGVDRSGRLSKDAEDPVIANAIVAHEGKLAFKIAEGVLLLQKDIRQLQLAKAAVRTGIDMLIKRAGLTAEKIDRVLVAGSFGYHLRTSSLLEIGLLPEAFEGKVDFVGNTSLSGAKLLLTNASSRARLAKIAAEVEAVSLAEDPYFQKAFVQAIQFPEFKEAITA